MRYQLNWLNTWPMKSENISAQPRKPGRRSKSSAELAKERETSEHTGFALVYSAATRYPYLAGFKKINAVGSSQSGWLAGLELLLYRVGCQRSVSDD